MHGGPKDGEVTSVPRRVSLGPAPLRGDCRALRRPEITPLNSAAAALMQSGDYCVNILLEHLSILIFHKVIFGVEQHGVLMFRGAPSCRKKEGAKETEEGGRGKRRRSVYLLECWELEFTTGA